MYVCSRLIVVSGGVVGLLAVALARPGPVWGREIATTRPSATSEPTSRPAASSRPLPGPKYAPLRQDDDFSYLDGPPGSYQPDFFDSLKRIHLGDKMTLRLGGEVRGRMEAVTHKRFGTREGRYGGAFPTQDTFFLHRYYYHADFQYDGLARVFFEGVAAWGEDIDQTPMPAFQDRFDVHQLFADVRPFGPTMSLTLRFGRQELNYGKQRLVSPLDWANVRRTWDAVKVFWSDKNWNIGAWYARPVDVRNQRRDTYDEDVHFYGLYSTYKGIKDHGVDAYFLALDNTGQYTNANTTTGDIGDLAVYTLGARFFGKTPVGGYVWDYDTELAGQWGKSAGDTIQAWMWTADTGYTLANWPLKPRIGLGLDYASGDDDPYDDIHGTFNQLYPLGHAFFGYLDQVARQNVWAQNVNLTVKPIEAVTAQMAFHTFWLDKDRDALYNAAGLPLRRNPYGQVGDLIGHELDLTISWQVDPHASLLFGYAHMWTSSHFFNRRNQPGENPDLFYVQYQYKF